jgi:hypothetical protein
MWITSGAWVIGGAVLMICEGEAICDALFFGSGVVLIIWFGPVVTGKLDNVADVIVSLDHFSGEEGAPQFFVPLHCFLPFDF